MCDKKCRLAVLVGAGLFYFVSYPEDLEALLAPVSALLNLTNSVSPLVYGVAAVGIIAAAIVKTAIVKTGASRGDQRESASTPPGL